MTLRLGVVPYCWDTTLPAWVSSARALAESGLVDGLFAPDHLRVRDRFDREVTVAWPVVLGAASQVCGLPLGPLVARCGSGADEQVMNALDTIASSAEVVANLGVGDRIGRLEAEAASMPWPPRRERVAQMAETAARRLSRGWETIAASDRTDLHASMPSGVGAHISAAQSLQDHGAGLDRQVSVSFWGEAETPSDLTYLTEGVYRWVCLTQFPGESSSELLSRLERSRMQLGLS